MKLILESDDLSPHPETDCLETISCLVKSYPKIKLSFFTPAAYKNYPLFADLDWCDAIRTHIEKGNVILCNHGLYHSQEEFKGLSEEEAGTKLDRITKVFNDSNLPLVKVFRGPHWGQCEGTYKALIARNYYSIYTHEDYRWLADKFPEIKSIYYNWNLKDNFEDANLEGEELIIAHSHSHNVCRNGIQESFGRICSFIDKYNPEFLFAHEI